MNELILSVIFPVFVIVCAGDLLYLYFTNQWYDIRDWVEITEVILLFIFVGLGVFRVIQIALRKPNDVH